MYKSLILSLAVAGTLLVSAPAYASYANPCQPIYGGGQNCVTKGQISLDKKVQDPKSKEYVDNLSRNNARYVAGQTVNFKLVVTNTGDSKIDEVTVTDTFPQFLNFVSGPGKFDNDSKTLTFTVSNLNASESRTYTVVGKVADAANLPKDAGITCVVNQAEAVADDSKSDDNANLCIETFVPMTKGGLPVMQAPNMTSTPATGPEMLPIIGLIPAGLGGLFLRKKSSK